MADIEKLLKHLTERGFKASCFQTAAEAVDYLDGELDGTVIGFGGSVTLRDIGLYERLQSHNTVIWHWKGASPAEARAAKVYISSLNGISETGEIVNIDGTGNRVSSITYGPEKVYLVAGINKIAPDFDGALRRARNIASPKNAQRLNLKTPCSVNADRCYDCKSHDRICRTLSVLWEKPNGIPEMEIVIIRQELGY